VTFLPPGFIRNQAAGRARRVGHRKRDPSAAASSHTTMQLTIGKLMLWLLSLDALAVLLQVHVGTSNKLSTRWSD
jgi:hypothetical protein